MEEIVSYDLEIEKQKACWFPFKTAYERRRIQPEHEKKPKVFVFERYDDVYSRSFELSLRRNDDTRSLQIESTQFVPETNHTIVDSPRVPSELDETETNSTITDDSELLFGEREIVQWAESNAHCLSRHFWINELVEGRSLACNDDLFGDGDSFTGIGRSLSTFRSQCTEEEESSTQIEQSIRFSSSPVPTPITPARIEIEYDFSKENLSFEQTEDIQSVQRRMCGAFNGREKSRGNPATHTATSSISNSSYSMFTKKDASHSHCSDSEMSHDLGYVSNTSNSRMTQNPQLSPHSSISKQNLGLPHASFREATFHVVRPKSVKSLKNRILCGTMKSSRRRKEEKASMDDDLSVKEEKKVDEPLHPEPTLPSYTSIEGKSPNTHCMGGPSFDALWLSNTAKKLYPKGCAVHQLPRVEARAMDDSTEPYFFVEVEATKRQLKIVKDLDEIKSREATLAFKETRVVEAARAASLVDDDSAFMERESIVDVLKKFAPKRSSSMKKGSAPQKQLKHGRRLEMPRITTALTPPRRTKNTAITVSPSTKMCIEPAVGSHEYDPANRLKRTQSSSAVDSSQRVDSHFSNTPRQESISLLLPNAKEASREWPSELPRSCTLNGEVNGAPKSKERTSALSEISSRVWYPEASRSYDPRRRQSLVDTQKITGVRPDHRLDTRKRSSTVSEHVYEVADPTVNLNPSLKTAQDVSGDLTHDFELARFPSFSTVDWNNASPEHVQTQHSSDVSSHKDYQAVWSRHRSDHPFECRFDPESELIKVESPTRGGLKMLTKKLTKGIDFHHDGSLEDTIIHPVVFVAESPDVENDAYYDDIDHRGVRRKSSFHTVSERRSKSWSTGPAKMWIDDDESELNTEAFQRLSMDADEDSIFSGLGEHSPSDREMVEASQHTGTGTNTAKILEKDSVMSGNSIAVAAKQSRNSKHSRGVSSRLSSGLSVLSRDEITAYTAAQSVLDEPFSCIDEWLD